jgi:hypothetical protein
MKKKLLVLMAADFFVIFAYKAFVDELFFPAMALVLLTFIYAFKINCKKCRRNQVFRGWSFFDLRLPGEKCYFCGENMEE